MKVMHAKESWLCTYIVYVKESCYDFIRYATYTVKNNESTNYWVKYWSRFSLCL